jgi:hypothetical protein
VGRFAIVVDQVSRPGECAIGEAGLGPLDGFVVAGVLGGEGFVQVDAEARLRVGVEVAVVELGAARKNFLTGTLYLLPGFGPPPVVLELH